MRMKQKGIKHIDISSTWGLISMEMAALCTPRQSFVRHITSQQVSFQDSKSNGALCYANFPYMAHVWSAAHPAAVLPPPPISLSPLHPNQEHFLLSVQSFMAASGGANGTLRQELRREVKLLFAEEATGLLFFCWATYVSRKFGITQMFFCCCYTAPKVCFSARLTQLS